MSATIQIRVKDESLMTKLMSLTWFIRLFKKSRIKVTIDGQEHELPACDEPYKYTVAAGTHVLKLEDPRGKGKKRGRKVAGAVFGAAMGFGMTGSVWGGALGALEASGSGKVKSDGSYEVNLTDGSMLAIVCQPTSKGGIKVTAEK